MIQASENNRQRIVCYCRSHSRGTLKGSTILIHSTLKTGYRGRHLWRSPLAIHPRGIHTMVPPEGGLRRLLPEGPGRVSWLW
jgi:hypothetical protein